MASGLHAVQVRCIQTEEGRSLLCVIVRQINGLSVDDQICEEGQVAVDAEVQTTAGFLCDCFILAVEESQQLLAPFPCRLEICFGIGEGFLCIFQLCGRFIRFRDPVVGFLHRIGPLFFGFLHGFDLIGKVRIGICGQVFYFLENICVQSICLFQFFGSFLRFFVSILRCLPGFFFCFFCLCQLLSCIFCCLFGFLKSSLCVLHALYQASYGICLFFRFLIVLLCLVCGLSALFSFSCSILCFFGSRSGSICSCFLGSFCLCQLFLLLIRCLLCGISLLFGFLQLLFQLIDAVCIKKLLQGFLGLLLLLLCLCYRILFLFQILTGFFLGILCSLKGILGSGNVGSCLLFFCLFVFYCLRGIRKGILCRPVFCLCGLKGIPGFLQYFIGCCLVSFFCLQIIGCCLCLILAVLQILLSFLKVCFGLSRCPFCIRQICFGLFDSFLCSFYVIGSLLISFLSIFLVCRRLLCCVGCCLLCSFLC